MKPDWESICEFFEMLSQVFCHEVMGVDMVNSLVLPLLRRVEKPLAPVAAVIWEIGGFAGWNNVCTSAGVL